MIHSLLLLALGAAVVAWRPCRDRAVRKPRLAIALLLGSALAVWIGSLGVIAGLASGQVFAPALVACGVLWRQLVTGEAAVWQLAVVAAWLVIVPARATVAVARDLRRNLKLTRVLQHTGTSMSYRARTILVVPGLSTPAITLGVHRRIVAVDADFWAGSSTVERDVVCAHEHGHVAGHHGFLAALSRLLTAGIAGLPGITQADDCVRRHIEALADDAAVRDHDSETVGATLGRIALAARPAAGLGVAGASLWRVQRLLQQDAPASPRERALLWLLLGAVTTGIVMTSAEVANALGPVIAPTVCRLP